jgi:hypothetical protein
MIAMGAEFADAYRGMTKRKGANIPRCHATVMETKA